MHFDTGNLEHDKVLNSLVYSASDHQETDARETLQIWLIGVIERIEQLPPDYQQAINPHNFYIGDEHYRIKQDRVGVLSRELVKKLKTGLAAVHSLVNPV